MVKKIKMEFILDEEFAGFRKLSALLKEHAFHLIQKRRHVQWIKDELVNACDFYSFQNEIEEKMRVERIKMARSECPLIQKECKKLQRQYKKEFVNRERAEILSRYSIGENKKQIDELNKRIEQIKKESECITEKLEELKMKKEDVKHAYSL